MKKILSLVLVIALVLGSFSFAFAATPADVVGEDYQEAVEVLMALGVVNGYPDGTYKPERVVTRAEMAKLLVEALGYGQLAGGTAPYSDTAGHWAQGSIGLASGIGLVQGYPDGTFKPDATVSFDEAVTMILRALGYTDASLRGAWPTNYKIKAIDLGLYDDTSAQTGGADRGNVAIMLFNALGASLVEVKDGVATAVETEPKTLVDKVGTKATKVITYDDVYGDDALKSEVDLSAYLYNEIEYYKNKTTGKIAYVADTNFNEMKLTNVEFVSGTTYRGKDSNDVVREFNVTGVAISYNYAQLTSGQHSPIAGSTVVVVYDNSWTNRVIKGVRAVEKTSSTLVDEYNERAFAIEAEDGVQINLPTKTVSARRALDTDRLVVKGAATSVENIKAYDVVEAYAADGYTPTGSGKLTLVVTRDSVDGRVTRVSGSDVTVGGVALKQETGVMSTDDVGETVTVYLNAAGKIQFVDTPATASSTYALLLATEQQKAGALGTTTLARVKMILADGSEVIYNIKKDLDTVKIDNVVVDITVPAFTTEGAFLAEYTLDSNGRIDKLVAVEADLNQNATYNSASKYITLGGSSYFFANDVVIFDTIEEDVVAVGSLDKDLTVSGWILSSTNKVLALGISAGGSTVSDDTYAYILGVATVVDPADSTKTTQEILALTAAGEVTYYAVAGETPVLKGEFAKLQFNSAGRVIADVDTYNVEPSVEVTAKQGQAVVAGGDLYDIATDVLVFVVILEADNVTIDTVVLGTYADVKVDSFVDTNIMTHTTTTGTNPVVKVIFVSDYEFGS
jgi:hypothetical protein